MATPKLQIDTGAAIDGYEVVKFVSGTGVTLSQSADDEKAVVTLVVDGASIASIDAANVDITDAGALISADNVEDALQEITAEIDLNTAAVAARQRFWVLTFEETAGAGTYTGQTAAVFPDGAVINYVAWKTTATWDADTTAIDIGVTGALTTWASAVDVDAAGADTLIPDPTATGPTIVSGGSTYGVASITTTGTGGTTGRTNVYFGFIVPDTTTAATKA